MPLETFGYIDDLDPSSPDGSTEYVSQGDDHIRGIKLTLRNTFPNLNAAVTLTPAQLNVLAGAFIQTLLDDADSATARATLGVRTIAQGSYTTASLATDAQDERSVTHGLGTDNVDFGAIAHGSQLLSSGGHNVLGMIVRPDKAMDMFGKGDPTSSPTVTTLPSSGDLRIAVRNNNSSAQTITVHWWARTRA